MAGPAKLKAYVFACLRSGELRVIVGSNIGMLDGGVGMDVPVENVPWGSRRPNAPLWVTWDPDAKSITKIEPRIETEP